MPGPVQSKGNERDENGVIRSVHVAAFRLKRSLGESEEDVHDGFDRSTIHWAAMGGVLPASSNEKKDALWALPVHYLVWGWPLDLPNVGRCARSPRSFSK